MFKLPVCPHCGTVYSYEEVKAAIKNKETTCYHCQKDFKAKRFPYVIVGAAIPVILCILVNIFLLSRMAVLQTMPLFAVTLIFVFVIYLIIPFFTKFKKIDDESKVYKAKKK